MRKAFTLANIFIVSLLIIAAIVWLRVWWVYCGEQNDQLRVTFLNVGQGDSILISTPGGKSILIDGGPYPHDWSTFDAGKYVVVPYLRRRRIKKLDLVIASHPDLDHIGGLLAVLKRFRIGEFIDSGTISSTQTYEDLLRLIEKKKIKYRVAGKNETINLADGITLQILSPISPAFKNNPNENSLVIKLTYGNCSFLFTGDIMAMAEPLYCQEYGEALQATILKSPHHGSNSSSGEEFLQTVRPEAVIISCARGNPFGHPGKEVIERYQQLGYNIYRTDALGHITVSSNGKGYEIKTQK